MARPGTAASREVVLSFANKRKNQENCRCFDAADPRLGGCTPPRPPKRKSEGAGAKRKQYYFSFLTPPPLPLPLSRGFPRTPVVFNGCYNLGRSRKRLLTQWELAGPCLISRQTPFTTNFPSVCRLSVRSLTAPAPPRSTLDLQTDPPAAWRSCCGAWRSGLQRRRGAIPRRPLRPRACGPALDPLQAARRSDRLKYPAAALG